MKIEYIYKKLKCGGLGYSDILIRYKDKYYLIDGYLSELENLNKIYNILDRTKYNNQKAYNTYLKHRNDNYITAKEFLNIIGEYNKK